VTVDDVGVPVGVPRRIRRVVSLVPSLTEAVAVTAPELLAGATDWCTHPAGLDVPRVRGTKNPDLDKIVGLRPDLVIANFEENRDADLTALRESGIAVWTTVIRTLPEAFTSLERMLAICGLDAPDWLADARAAWEPGRARPEGDAEAPHETAGETPRRTTGAETRETTGAETRETPGAETREATGAETREATGERPRMTAGAAARDHDAPAGAARHAVVPIWRRPWMVLGRDTFAGDVLARLGVHNLYGRADERYPRVTVADMTARDPDLVVLPDEPYAFGPGDGPEAFPGHAVALVSGRHLEWYGPSLAEAPAVLRAQLGAARPPR
jgi:hypothetical protein